MTRPNKDELRSKNHLVLIGLTIAVLLVVGGVLLSSIATSNTRQVSVTAKQVASNAQQLAKENRVLSGYEGATAEVTLLADEATQVVSINTGRDVTLVASPVLNPDYNFQVNVSGETGSACLTLDPKTGVWSSYKGQCI
jgi:hypothetical protein